MEHVLAWLRYQPRQPDRQFVDPDGKLLGVGALYMIIDGRLCQTRGRLVIHAKVSSRQAVPVRR